MRRHPDLVSTALAAAALAAAILLSPWGARAHNGGDDARGAALAAADTPYRACSSDAACRRKTLHDDSQIPTRTATLGHEF